jgi:NAD-dependent DNA ligase
VKDELAPKQLHKLTTLSAAVERVNLLVDELNTHRRAYYENNTVLISDAQYDQLFLMVFYGQF